MKQRGQALLIGIVFLAVLLTLSLALSSATLQSGKASRENYLYLEARALAEAGVEKALWCLGQFSGGNCGGTYGPGYTGEASVPFGSGVFTTSLTSISGGKKEITSTGFIPNALNPVKKVTIKVRAVIDTTTVGFRFGMQADVGGVTLEENSVINGNLYSNGNVVGASGASVTGDVLVSGAGDQITLEQWTSGSGELRFGYNDGKEDIAQKFIASTSTIIGRVEVKLRKASNPNDINIYIVRDKNGLPDATKIGDGKITASSVGGSLAFVSTTLTNAAPVAYLKGYWLVLDAAQSSSKYYYAGLDATDGYASGTAKYSDGWDTDPWINAGGDIGFKIFAGGADNKIENITIGNDAQGTTFKNGAIGRDLKTKKTIKDATIGRDAYALSIDHSNLGRDGYANTITNTTVGGSSFPGNGINEPPKENLGVTEAMIIAWRSDAESGGTQNGNYTTSPNQTVNLGPKKINGNMTLANGTTLTVDGTLFVTGDIDIGNNVTIRLGSGYGSASGLILADGTIHTGENDAFAGSGQAGSYMMLISAAAGGGHHDSAIDVHKSTEGIIFAAPYGKINLHQNVTAKQVSGFSINVENNGTITYETGLQNAQFSSGPGGTWEIEPGTWREIP